MILELFLSLEKLRFEWYEVEIQLHGTSVSLCLWPSWMWHNGSVAELKAQLRPLCRDYTQGKYFRHGANTAVRQSDLPQ
jgi:hypothetical protein